MRISHRDWKIVETGGGGNPNRRDEEPQRLAVEPGKRRAVLLALRQCGGTACG